MPTKIFLFRLSFRVDNNLHSHFIEIIHFVLIENFEFHCVIFKGVRYFKEKPLRVSIGIYIIL